MLPAVSNATEEADPLAGFAALMAGAGQEAKGGAEADPAPYGYTKDEQTGEMRPKKSPGRPRKSPSLDDLKERQEQAAADSPSPNGDRAPAASKGRKGRARTREARPAPPVPQSLRMEGSIAKGINQLYRRAGKMIRVADHDIGQAFIDCTRAEDPEDVTVGDAWEALCRANPRVKAFWVRMLAGGAMGQVFMAHMPILAAIIMKDAIRNRLPFWRLAEAVTDDEGGPGEAPAAGTPFDGMSQQDMAEMVAFAQATAERMMGNGGPPRGE